MMKCLAFALACLILGTSLKHDLVADEPTAPSVAPENYIKLPQQKIEFSQDRQHIILNVGPVECGTRSELSVILRNKTLTDFGPLEGKSSCSCLVGVMKDQTVLAGGETEIRIRFASPVDPRKAVQRLELKSKTDDRRIAIQLSIDARRSMELETRRFALPSNKNTLNLDLVFNPQLPDIDLAQLDVRSRSKKLSIEKVWRDELRGKLVARCSATVDDLRSEAALEGKTTLIVQVVPKSSSYAFSPTELPLEVYAADLWRLKPTIMSFYSNADCYESKFFLFNPQLDQSNIPKLSGKIELEDGSTHELNVSDVKIKAQVLTGMLSLPNLVAANLAGKEFKVYIVSDSVCLANSVGQMQNSTPKSKD